MNVVQGSFPGGTRIGFSVRSSYPVIRTLALACSPVLLAGCAGDAPVDPSGAGTSVPGVRSASGSLRLDAAWGNLIVVPATRLPAGAMETLADANRRASVHTDDGRPVHVDVRILESRGTLSPSLPPTNRRGWLPSVGAWSTIDIPVGKPLGPSSGENYAASPFAMIELPLGTLGQGVWIGDTRLEVNWLQSSRTIADRLPELNWASPLASDAAASPMVRAALDAERASPFRRWRAKLGAGTLVPTGDRDDQAPSTAKFDDPALELIAQQIEERWTVALARLGEADTSVYDKVRRALVLTSSVRTSAGLTVVPVWPTDQDVLDDLLVSLLAPRATELQRKEAAARFLRACPVAVGWVADDASSLDATTLEPVVVVGAANFSDEPAAASVRWPRSPLSPDFEPVPARSSTFLTVPALEGFASPVRTPLSYRIGDWMGSPAASPSAIAVQPPGAFLGPLSLDWSLASWLAASPPTLQPPLALSLLRTPSPNPRARPVNEGWVLYGEIASPTIAGTVRIWLGSAASARAPLTFPIKVETEAASTVRTFSMPIPADAIGRGIMLIGVDAELSIQDAQTHWSWPRPMFPWQVAPSRAALDLTQWGGVAPPSGPPTR